MRYKNLIFGVGLAMASQLAAGTARADIPPPGLCNGSAKAGDECDEPVDTGGEMVDGAGKCVDEMCTRGSPNGTITYECLMCRAAKSEPDPAVGGAGGDPIDPDEPGGKGGTGSQAGSAGKAGGSGTSKPKDDEGGGCSMGRASGAGAPLAAGALVLLGLAYRRRRGAGAV